MSVIPLTLLFLLFGASIPTVETRADNPVKSPVIRITPPAPVFDQKERLAELARRRARVAQAIGPKGILILFSAEPRVYTHDVDYEYRQENNLYYLTNLKQRRATLVLIPGNTETPEILFIPRRDPLAETWNGRMYSAEEAARASGIREIWEAREFEPFQQALRARQTYRPKPENILMSAGSAATQPSGTSEYESLFTAVGKNEGELYMLVPRGNYSREYGPEQRFLADWTKNTVGYSVKNAAPIFAEMRLRKSPMELRLLQHAIDITIEAQQRAWLAAGDAKWEYEVDAQVIYTFKLRNADHWGYPSIVGCGPNATTLHYIESQGPVAPGDLILMDVGAEYDHYTADVTRTFPVSGRFSPAQAEVYQIVYDAQEAGARVIRPGAMYSDVHRAATEVIKDGLLKLGLITDRNSEQYRMWFMHGTTHWLGMNVHDVGYSARLEPGMVFTNEPGIYVRVDALEHQPLGWQPAAWEKFKAAVRPAFEKYKGIGVRIEDDMLVTQDGVRWMTEALPRKMSEIERFIAQADQKQKIEISSFDVPDIPLRIDSGVLVRTSKGYVLRCSIGNQSNEQITGVDLLVLVFDSSHRFKDRAQWSERLELSAYSMEEYSFTLPTKGIVTTTDQIGVVAERVTGRESIWQVVKAENALKAYITSGQLSSPDVRRLSNRWLWP